MHRRSLAGCLADPVVEASIIVLGALWAVFSILPLFPVIGVSGASISLGAVSGALAGLLLGPVAGPVSALLGSAISIAVNPGVLGFLGPFAVLPQFMAALATGLYLYRRHLLGVIVLVSGVVLFLAVTAPDAADYWVYAAYHVAAVAAYPGLVAARRLASPGLYGKIDLFYAGILGVLTDHIYGSAGFIAYNVYLLGSGSLGFFSVFFKAALPIYPVERTVLAVVFFAVSVSVKRQWESLVGWRVYGCLSRQGE